MRQLLYSLLVFVIVFAGLNLRMLFMNLTAKRKTSFKKEWKFILLLSFVGAVIFFIIESIYSLS
jgi:hypothetical protein